MVIESNKGADRACGMGAISNIEMTPPHSRLQLLNRISLLPAPVIDGCDSHLAAEVHIAQRHLRVRRHLRQRIHHRLRKLHLAPVVVHLHHREVIGRRVLQHRPAVLRANLNVLLSILTAVHEGLRAVKHLHLRVHRYRQHTALVVLLHRRHLLHIQPEQRFAVLRQVRVHVHQAHYLLLARFHLKERRTRYQGHAVLCLIRVVYPHLPAVGFLRPIAHLKGGVLLPALIDKTGAVQGERRHRLAHHQHQGRGHQSLF
ncbi:hypothetical protein yruck0001_16340 [Yersinia ruckeri ATCC 29473]|uniref:Uncharacterized protein n=1 Tax=Yersinia ruckeri TaxID=29486 RepID=A0A0A8VH92_YERRU|nr:hypothetical protein yruck0001_16340 [Yersinia ruckeri ATCC 29473]CEK27329.1 hypothetical protein CSF007_7865 [Yersinia ruckeri]